MLLMDSSEKDREGTTRFGVIMDKDDVDYPRTINRDLMAAGLTPDDVDYVGNVTLLYLVSLLIRSTWKQQCLVMLRAPTIMNHLLPLVVSIPNLVSRILCQS